ncbi:unnamed protein product [Ilex paraguariensis]|uniref:Ubiquinone biosynthesis protein COQ4 homolog, mitochondrial n=1 Tax=Ilex paraguariensis TaxID=185542 RepID=A0ABC8UYP0_9AQUA
MTDATEYITVDHHYNSMTGDGDGVVVNYGIKSIHNASGDGVTITAVLLERPRIISANVGHAWDLPANTFGAAYASFMGSRNFSPDDRPPVRFMETEELAYVAMRAREVHDFWHTLFGLPTNLIGESALKVIEFEQMLLPMCLMSVIGGTARFSEKQRTLFYQHYFPWAIQAGMRCTDLMCVYYERHFDEDLEDVRRRWGIIPAPLVPMPKAARVA